MSLPLVYSRPTSPLAQSIVAKFDLWLDNGNISSSVWKDKSSNNNDATAVSGSEPTLSGKELVFATTGSGDAMTLASEINLIGKTVYMLSRADAGLSAAGQIMSHTTDNVQIRYSTTAQTTVTGSPNLGGAFAISGQDTTIYRIIKLEITASTAQMFYANDSLQSSQNSHAVTEFMFNQIGRRGAADEPLNGRIKSVIIGTGLTAAEKTTIENYLETLR